MEGDCMSKQLRLMILANVVLVTVCVVLNWAYYLYGYDPGHAVQWTPLFLRFYNYQLPGGDFGITIPNFTFYLFWAAVAVDVYTTVNLQRSREI